MSILPVSQSVDLSDGLSNVHYGKTADSIEMPFAEVDRVH